MEEKTADEMFEELGYTVSNGKWEEHLNTTTNTVVDNGYIQIIFYTNRTIYIDSDDIMNMKELQAINKKVEELRMGKIVQIPKIICEECKKREATRLCDYEIGHNIDLVGPGKAKRVTCDKKLCVKCATKINNKDYCKKHIEAIRQELGGVLSERK